MVAVRPLLSVGVLLVLGLSPLAIGQDTCYNTDEHNEICIRGGPTVGDGSVAPPISPEWWNDRVTGAHAALAGAEAQARDAARQGTQTVVQAQTVVVENADAIAQALSLLAAEATAPTQGMLNNAPTTPPATPAAPVPAEVEPAPLQAVVDSARDDAESRATSKLAAPPAVPNVAAPSTEAAPAVPFPRVDEPAPLTEETAQATPIPGVAAPGAEEASNAWYETLFLQSTLVPASPNEATRTPPFMARADPEPAAPGLPDRAWRLATFTRSSEAAFAASSETMPLGALRALATSTMVLALAGAAFLLPVAVLYRRIARDRLLDKESRRRILEYVIANPGRTAAQVSADLSLYYTTTKYHLRILEEYGSVTPRKFGRERRYFENHSRYAEAEARTLAHGARRENAAFLRALAHTGDGQRAPEVGARVGLARSTAFRRAAILQQEGLVASENGRLRLTLAGAAALAISIAHD